MIPIRYDIDYSNPKERVPLLFSLDVSSSMGKHGALEELNAGLKLFWDETAADPVVAQSLDICVIAFAGQCGLVRPFQEFEHQNKAPVLSIRQGGVLQDGTNLPRAICEGLKLLDERQQQLREAGCSARKAIYVVMTDGIPESSEMVERRVELRRKEDLLKKEDLLNDEKFCRLLEKLQKELEVSKSRIQKMKKDRGLLLWPIPMGEKASVKVLEGLRTDPFPIQRMRPERIRAFFARLFVSVVSQSAKSQPGELFQLPYEEFADDGRSAEEILSKVVQEPEEEDLARQPPQSPPVQRAPSDAERRADQTRDYQEGIVIL